ncbi:hypothetical protein [Slackia exigua]|uniref:hypothetical protein n=1 Tax=Slackia exigua TaxID=84109 RepID=UPI0023F03B66|nr:hypothetical protein [Slackia exigua]
MTPKRYVLKPKKAEAFELQLYHQVEMPEWFDIEATYCIEGSSAFKIHLRSGDIVIAAEGDWIVKLEGEPCCHVCPAALFDDRFEEVEDA